MRPRFSRFGLLAALGMMAGTVPTAVGPLQVSVSAQQGENKQSAPAPTPTAKTGQTVSAETIGSFTVRASGRREPIWIGRPRGSYAGKFKRIRGQRWA